MMKPFAIAIVTTLFFASGAKAQCTTEDTLLDACMSAAGVGDPGKTACDLCVTAAAGVAVAAGITCEELSDADNGLCKALGACPTCPEGCSREVHDYALCEVNDDAGTSCTDLTCNLDGNGATDAPPTEAGTPTDAPAPTDTGPPADAPAPTDADAGADECTIEDAAFDTCMTNAGVGNTEKTACDTCVETAAEIAAFASVSCETLASGTSELCDALTGCPGCVPECMDDAQVYALCEINAELGNDCSTLICSDTMPTDATPTDASPTDAMPTDATPTDAMPTDAPPPTDATPPTGAPPTEAPTSSAALKTLMPAMIAAFSIMMAVM